MMRQQQQHHNNSHQQQLVDSDNNNNTDSNNSNDNDSFWRQILGPTNYHKLHQRHQHQQQQQHNNKNHHHSSSNNNNQSFLSQISLHFNNNQQSDDNDNDNDEDDDDNNIDIDNSSSSSSSLNSYNDFDEFNIKQIKQWWIKYQNSISKNEREFSLIKLVTLISDSFDSNSDIHYVLPFYNMDISQLVTDLSLEFLRHFCDLFKVEYGVTPNNVIKFINRYIPTTSSNTDINGNSNNGNLDYFVNSIIERMDFDKIKNFYFKPQLEYPYYSYHDSLCNLITKSLSLLLESCNNVNIMNGLSTVIITSMRLSSVWFGLPLLQQTHSNSSSNNNNSTTTNNSNSNDNKLTIENTNYTILSPIQERLAEYIQVYYTYSTTITTPNTLSSSSTPSTPTSASSPSSTNNNNNNNNSRSGAAGFSGSSASASGSAGGEQYKIRQHLTTEDFNPLIILSNLLLQISKKHSSVFIEVFQWTSLWKIVIDIFKQLSSNHRHQEKACSSSDEKPSSDGNGTRDEKACSSNDKKSEINIEYFIQFCNFTSLSFGNMFINASKDIRKLIELSSSKVFIQLLQYLEQFENSLNTPGNSSSISKISILYIIEICVWALFTSLHLIPNLLIEFQHCDGYDLLKRVFYSIIIKNNSSNNTSNSNSTSSGSSSASNSGDKDKQLFLLQFQQEKMLTILHVMINLVLELTTRIQLINQHEQQHDDDEEHSHSNTHSNSHSNSPLLKCKRNQHVFGLLVYLYHHTDMSKINNFQCKRELLDHLLSNLTLFHEEYFNILYQCEPFKFICQNFTKTSCEMQIQVLKTLDHYIQLFTSGQCLEFEESLICRDFNEYLSLLTNSNSNFTTTTSSTTTNSSTTTTNDGNNNNSMMRVCNHLISKIQDASISHSIQLLFRKSGFTSILLQSLSNIKNLNTEIVSKLIQLLYLFLEGNLDNHQDFMKQLKPKRNPIYQLLYDYEELIDETMRVISIIVVNDKLQQWDYIISDLLEIMFIKHSNGHSNGQSSGSVSSGSGGGQSGEVKEEDEEATRKHLRMCEKILYCIRKMFLENSNVKNSFRKCKGYEKIVNLLSLISSIQESHLKNNNNTNSTNSTNTNSSDQHTGVGSEFIYNIFSIVQSCINLLTLSMIENSDNELYFKKFITFSSLLSPLHKCGFVKSYEHGIHLTMNLLQFSVMDYSLYDFNTTNTNSTTNMSNSTSNNNNSLNSLIIVDYFKQSIETKVLLFENPEMIPEVILKLYGRNLNQIDQKLSNFLMDMLFRLVKFSTNRHRLSKAKSLLILMKEFSVVLLDPAHYLSNRITKLLILLGAHNFSPREMQYYFTLFSPPDRLNSLLINQTSSLINNSNNNTSNSNINNSNGSFNSSSDSNSNSNLGSSNNNIGSSNSNNNLSTKTINNLLKTLLELSGEQQQPFIPNYYIDFSPLNKDKIFQYDDLTQLKLSKRLRLFSSSQSKMAHDREERILLKRTLNTYSSILFPKLNYSSSWPSEKGHTTTLWFRIEKCLNSKINLLSFSSHLNSIVFNISINHSNISNNSNGMNLTIEMERTNENREYDSSSSTGGGSTGGTNGSVGGGSAGGNSNRWSKTFDYEFKLYQWYFIGINQQLVPITQKDRIEHRFGLFVNGFHQQQVSHQESMDKSLMDLFKSFFTVGGSLGSGGGSSSRLEFVVMGSNAYEISKTVNQTMKSVNSNNKTGRSSIISNSNRGSTSSTLLKSSSLTNNNNGGSIVNNTNSNSGGTVLLNSARSTSSTASNDTTTTTTTTTGGGGAGTTATTETTATVVSTATVAAATSPSDEGHHSNNMNHLSTTNNNNLNTTTNSVNTNNTNTNTNTPNIQLLTMNQQQLFTCPAFQLGNMFFIEECLNDEEMYMMYHLGPNYMGNFDEDLSQYFCNEMINEDSVVKFKNKIYYMKDCSNNVGLSQLCNRFVFAFSSVDASLITRLAQQSQSNSLDTVDIVFSNNKKKKMSSSNTNTTNVKKNTLPTNTTTSTSTTTESAVVGHNATISNNNSSMLTIGISSPTPSTPPTPSTTTTTTPTTTTSIDSTTDTTNNSSSSSSPSSSKQSASIYNTSDIRSYIPNRHFNNATALTYQKTSNFTSIKCYLSGKTTLVSKCTFKGNLYVVGGMKSILGLYAKMKDPSSKIYTLLLLSYLMKNNSLNTLEMLQLGGYDMLNYHFLSSSPSSSSSSGGSGNNNRDSSQQQFEISPSVLMALLVMCGLDIPNHIILNSIDNSNSSSSNSSSSVKVRDVCKRGVINNFMAFEKLLLDYRIWHSNAKVDTLKKMLKCLAELVSSSFRSKVSEHHRAILLTTANGIKRLLFAMSQCYVIGEKINWPIKIINPTIKILKCIIPTPISMTYLYPIVQYIILTHHQDYAQWMNENNMQQQLMTTSMMGAGSASSSGNGSGRDTYYGNVEIIEPRKSVLNMFYSLIEEAPEDVLEDFHSVLPTGQIIALLNTKSNLIRCILLKMLGVYLSRKESLREQFVKSNAAHLLTLQLLEVGNPSLLEFQVMFDLMLGLFNNNNNNTGAANSGNNDYNTVMASPVKSSRRNSIILSAGTTTTTTNNSSNNSNSGNSNENDCGDSNGLIELGEGTDDDNDKSALHRTSLFLPTSISHAALLLPKSMMTSTTSSSSSNNSSITDSPTKKRSRSVYFKSMNASTIANTTGINNTSSIASSPTHSMTLLTTTTNTNTNTNTNYNNYSGGYGQSDMSPKRITPPSPTGGIGGNGNRYNTTNRLKNSISLIKYEFTHFEFREFLTPILRLIPCIRDIEEKINVFETICKLFKQGGEKLKLYFYEIKAHWFIQVYLSNLPATATSTTSAGGSGGSKSPTTTSPQVNKFIKLTLDFIIDYVNYSILNISKQNFNQYGLKGSVEILTNILQYLLVMEKSSYDIIFIQNMQRYILQGVLAFFQKNYLFNSSPSSSHSGGNGGNGQQSNKQLQKKEKKIRGHLSAVFISFCTCATDYIIQWFDLPPEPPVYNNINNNNNNNSSSGGNEQTVNNNTTAANSVGQKYGNVGSTRRNLGRMFDVVDTTNINNNNQYLNVGGVSSGTTLKTSTSMIFETQHHNVDSNESSEQSTVNNSNHSSGGNNNGIITNNNNSNQQQQQQFNVQFIDNYATSSTTKSVVKIKKQQEPSWDQRNLSATIFYNYERKLSNNNETTTDNNTTGDDNNTPTNNTNTNNSNSNTSSNNSSLFSHSIHDISGFIYWFIDSIRTCLLIQKKGKSTYYSTNYRQGSSGGGGATSGSGGGGDNNSNSSFSDENQDFTPITTPEFILVEQLKRIFMFLLDSKRSKTDHIFTLLQLLYFFPFHSELIIHDLEQEPPGQQEMLNCGKLLKSFCSDNKYITRLLFRTVNLFSNDDSDQSSNQQQTTSNSSSGGDCILPQLNRKVWKVIISTCRDFSYLKRNPIFPKMFDPNDPEFVSMVEEASSISDNISSLVFEPSVLDQVREWESNEFSTFNSKLTAVTEIILKSEESDKKKDSNIRKTLRNEQTQLELNKLKYMKPHMLKLKSIKDTDLQARKQWKMLVKFIQQDVSAFNVYFHTTNSYCDKTIKTRSTITTTRSHVTRENDYHRLSFLPYDDDTFENVDYKLDSTSGPNRVRMRMKRQLKKRPFKIDEFQKQSTTNTNSTNTNNNNNNSNTNSAGGDGKKSVKFSENTIVHSSNNNNGLQQQQDDDEASTCSSNTTTTTTTTTTMNENSYHLSISTIILEPKKCKRITPLRITEGDLILGEDGVYFIAQCSYPLTIRTNSSIHSTTNTNTTNNTNTSGVGSSSSHRSSSSQQLEMKKTYVLSYEEIREIHNRRYLLKNNALEFFLLNGKSFFFAFEDGETRDRVSSMLSSPTNGYYRFNYLSNYTSSSSNSNNNNSNSNSSSLTPNLNLLNLVNYEEEVNGKLIFKKSITQKWVEGTISNFEYLMHLNILAGRSFNDLTQYPVFPFILRDYDSTELDLSDPNTFRDLRKPMGALNEKRLEKIIQQYENLKEIEDQIPYHYGSHYSTPIAVSYYLVRMEPFTRIFFEFNDGKLDLPDRTFHSIKKSWELSSGETQSKSDFKELTPEFYYLPEFLQNRNRIDFGILQNDKSFDDVELPPWANNDPVLFIRKHRKALESDYVSRNLHHWIDLIFGYKQRGELAINNYNVFHYMTYEGSLYTDEVDLIDDPITREARWTQICTYGQTPKQLFRKSHPERYATTNLMGGEEDTINVIPITNYIFKVANELSPGNIRIFKEAVGDIYIRNDQTTHNNSVIAVGKYKIFLRSALSSSSSSPLVYLSYGPGHWDKTLRIERWDNGKPLHIYHFMNQPEIYKCAKFSHDGGVLVVGSSVGSLHVFKVNNRIKIHHNKTSPETTNINTDKNQKFLDHVSTLSGHSDSVLCVAISTEYSMIISGSRDSCMMIWDLNRFCFVKSIKHDGKVTCLATSPTTGDIASFCQNNVNGQNHLYLWTVNGDLISYCNIRAKITCMKFTWMDEGINQNVLVCGLANGTIAILDALGLKVISKLKITDYVSPIRSLEINSPMTEIVAGDDRGFVVSWYCKKQ